ncbi:MAG: hypothetical protein LUD27_06665 [Clostridia bacterium]|nr:hypothetical protein [Clostridia bacterium]
MQRNFGIKDLDHIVRVKYAYGLEKTEDFAKYRYLMQNCKTQLDKTASLLTNNLVAAKSIYPTSMEEYNQRRSFQNLAIANCEQILVELQHTVDIFEVNVNVYRTHIKAIDREIGLIKKWRQRDNKIKSYLQG